MIRNFFGRLFYAIPQKPQTAQIAVTNVCNFNCAMCQRHDLHVEIKHMEAKIFERILKKIKDIPNLILTSWGEPFTHPLIFDFIKMAAKNHRVRMTSNGALLDDEKIEKILTSGLNTLTFSLDSVETTENYGHPVFAQLENIEKLAKRNQACGQPIKIFLQAVFLKYDENNFRNLIGFAKKIKIDRIRLTRVDLRFHEYPRPTRKEEIKMVKFIEKDLKGSNIGFDFLPYVAFDGIMRKIFKLIYPLLHRFGKFCLRTYDDIYINERGEITPCCSLPNLNCGNILNQELATIWQGEKFSNFRKKQNEYCGKCDILKIKIK